MRTKQFPKPKFPPSPSYDFERWQNRPVFVSQCYTWAVAHKIIAEPDFWFRALRPYRTAKAKLDRIATAREVRRIRSSGAFDLSPLYYPHREKNPGLVTAYKNLETMLGCKA